MKTTYVKRYSKDIGVQRSLMGDKVFKYILQFSLRFTVCCDEIICLTNLTMSFTN